VRVTIDELFSSLVIRTFAFLGFPLKTHRTQNRIMNRIELPTQSITTSTSFTGSDRSLDVAALDTRRKVREGLSPYTTFVPMHYERGYAYPLVVWLHSSPGNERELRQVMPLVSMRNYVAVAPRGTFAVRRMTDAYGWRQSVADIEEAEERIDDSVRLTRQRYNIHPDRIFVVGHGSGGTMALRVAWNSPQKYAGVATIGGPMPWHLQPLRRVKDIRRLPCLLAMSRRSRDYPDTRVCNDLRLLHAAGCTVALRQYPAGDELTTVMLSDLDRWLMGFICGSSDS
jgi:phospholipase/carboxylesterase